MKLIERDDELTLLGRQLWMAETKSSRMTLLSGPHGCGKTALAAEAYRDKPLLYFRMGRKTPALLTADWVAQAEALLGASVPGNAHSVPGLVDYLMYLSEKEPFTLILDECQLLPLKDFSEIRDCWRQRRNKTHLNLVLLCSSRKRTEELTAHDHSPLVSLLDLHLEMGPLKVEALKAHLGLAGEDLLTAFMVTGAMPYRTAWLKEAGCRTRQEILDFYFSEDSPFLRDGEQLLCRVLGKNSEVYLSILQSIAQGTVSQSEMEDRLGGVIIGGHLAKLETEYELIRKTRPMLAGPASRGVVRYEIADPALRFWLRHVEARRAEYELGRLDRMKAAAAADFAVSAHGALREWFLRKFREESGYRELGGEWSSVHAGDAGPEIDIIGFPPRARKALVCDVELRAEDFKKEPFLGKVASLRKGPLKEYAVDARLFTLADM